ncbi:MAG: tetratricopeptide repeat protein, partial [Armatimonadota bacterium]|nr:tetratricopeptide repeat protein [Armatimonadota bacterium]
MEREFPRELNTDVDQWLDQIDLLEIEALTPEEAERLEAMIEHDLFALPAEEELVSEEAQQAAQEGDECLAQDLVEEAILAYQRMIQADPGSLEAHLRIADAYLLADMSSQAVRHYRRAARRHPKKAEPHFRLGEVYRRYGLLKVAIAEYRKAVELSP